jgi:hypothetical protein
VDILGIVRDAGGEDKLSPADRRVYEQVATDVAEIAGLLVTLHDGEECDQFARLAEQLVKEAREPFLQSVPAEVRGKMEHVLSIIGAPQMDAGLDGILEQLTKMGVKVQVLKVKGVKQPPLKQAEDNALKDILGDIFGVDGEGQGPKRPSDN